MTFCGNWRDANRCGNHLGRRLPKANCVVSDKVDVVIAGNDTCCDVGIVDSLIVLQVLDVLCCKAPRVVSAEQDIEGDSQVGHIVESI